MKQRNFSLLLIFCLLAGFSFAQNTEEISKPIFTTTAAEFKIVPAFSQQRHVGPDLTPRTVNNGRWLNYPTNFNAYPHGSDILKQETMGNIPGRMPIVNIDGATEGVHTGATPPDPTGAVGPNHYIHSYNSGFVIFDKSGNVLMDHASLGMLWPGETTGDPIVLYDRYAQRFVITQFDGSPNGILFAVCQGEDPVNDGWYTYRFNTDSFPDYPHYAVWHDGYYFTANKGGNHFYVVERDVMVAGDPNPQMQEFTLPGISGNPNTVFAPMPVNSIGPDLPDASSPGYVTYLQDDAWAGGVDHLKMWEVELDWANTANSFISAPIQINTTPFDSFVANFGVGGVEQPGTTQKIDGITGVISYSPNYYNFGTHNSVTVNFNVDVNGDNGLLGIRWFELRVDGGGAWTIENEGTFAPNDGLSRFMGSMAIDASGNIGLAYNVGGPTMFPSLRYTGRFATSPAGVMDIAEETIVDGLGSQTNTNRFGDYAHLTLDPVDNQTFWHTGEYMSSANTWSTRIAAFKIAPEETTDVGAIAITAPASVASTATETITIELFNFGTDAQSNIPVWYQIDGGAMQMETFAGPLAPMTSAFHTFGTTGDFSTDGQVYTIVASTDLAGDANTSNDPISKQVTNVAADDIGVTAVISPVTGVGLTGAEVVEVTITNFGGAAQSNFDVTFTLDGGTPVTEQVAGPLNPGESIDYTFASETIDLSAFTVYELSATTSLPGDFDTSNDAITVSVYNASCIPASTSCNLDGLKKFILNTIDIGDGANGCNSTGAVNGYNDFTSMSTDLDRAAGNNTHLLQAQHNWADGATVEQLSVWIDFDDDGTFATTEQLIVAENYTVAQALNDFDLVIPVDANLGSHILRARGLDPTGNPGDPNDPCAPMQFGETIDITVNIIDTDLSINDQTLNNAEFNIYDRGDNRYEVVMKPIGFSDQLVISMNNVLGQRLVKNRVDYENGEYRYMLDLNGLSSGVYLVRLGTNSFGRVKRIIVD